MRTSIAPVYIKREGAIKGRYAYSLGSDEVYDYYVRSEELKRQLENIKEPITDEISLKIKSQETDSARKVLINLKRDIFNLRKNLLKIVDENRELLDKNGLSKQLNDFIAVFKEWIDLQESYDSLFEREKELERERLVNAYIENEEVLAKGMKFIHPSTLQKLKYYTSIPACEHKAKQRKCDDTVAKVITRAAHKTSPFSTFTHVGAGIMGEDVHDLEQNKYKTITKFNIVYALRIFEKVILLPEIIQESTYKFADTLVYLRGKFYWTILKDDPKKRKKVYKTVDELITVNGNSVLELIYNTFAEKNSFTFKQLHDLLTRNGMTDEKADHFLVTLVQKQFFSNVVFLDQNSDDIIGDFIRILEDYEQRCNSVMINRLLTNLRLVEKEMLEFDKNDAKEQLRSLDRITGYCQEITSEYQLEEFDEKQVLYMDSILNHIPAIDQEEWMPVLDSLSKFQMFAKIFDISYRFQLMLGTKFFEKFGTEEVSVKEKEHIILDVLLSNLIAHTDLWDNQLRISDDNFGIEEIRRLEALKCRFLNRLYADEKKDHIDITTEELQKYIDEFPELVKKQPQSNSFFIQDTKNNRLKVLNDFYAGHMIFFARFLRNMPYVYENDKFKDYIKTTMWDENLADMYLMYGFNANRRRSLTQKAVTLPNNRLINNELGQFDEVVDMRDLTMKYDTEEKRIKIYKNKEEIKPQFLGTLVTTLLPSIPAMLHLLNFNVVLLKDIGYSLIFNFLEQKKEFDVMEFPRIVLDGNVVLARKRWLINTDCMVSIRNAKDNELVEKCFDFMQKYAVPRRVFVSKFFYKNEGLNTGDDNTDKPIFMDMSSPILTVVLKKMIMDTKYIIIEELLPDLTANEQEEYVGEYIFEISHTNEG